MAEPMKLLRFSDLHTDTAAPTRLVELADSINGV